MFERKKYLGFRCTLKKQICDLTLFFEIMHCARNLQIMVNNIIRVELFPRINSRLLANERTDGDYNL